MGESDMASGVSQRREGDPGLTTRASLNPPYPHVKLSRLIFMACRDL